MSKRLAVVMLFFAAMPAFGTPPPTQKEPVTKMAVICFIEGDTSVTPSSSSWPARRPPSATWN